MGDPAGIGPEICLRALDDPRVHFFGDVLLFLAVRGGGAVVVSVGHGHSD